MMWTEVLQIGKRLENYRNSIYQKTIRRRLLVTPESWTAYSDDYSLQQKVGQHSDDYLSHQKVGQPRVMIIGHIKKLSSLE